MIKVNYIEVLNALERAGIEAFLTSKDDSWNQIVARDNPSLEFSTWYEIDGNQEIEVEDDFFELWG